MSSARIVLSSTVAYGQGKTTVTAALARRLICERLRVRVFKTGPDFFDPTMLQCACGSPVPALQADVGELRGHMFHYSIFTTLITPSACIVKRAAGKSTAGEAVYRRHALTATYFHAYFPSCPEAMARLFSTAEQA